MRTYLKILLLILVGFSANAQTPLPSGLPSPKSTSWYEIGWMQTDSGIVNSIRDTTMRSRFPGTQFMWQHAGLDTNVWFNDGRKYFRYLKTGQDVINVLGFTPGPAFTLTTIGNSGPATYIGNVLNIPSYSGGGGGGNIVSLNGLTAAAQFLIPGTSGSDFNIAQTGLATNVFNLPTAGPSTRGALSTSDWTLFNGKQPQLNGTGFVKVAGTTVSYDNNSYYLTSNPSSYISRTGLSALPPVLYNNTTGVFSADTSTGLTHLATQAYVLANQAAGTITGAGNLAPIFTTSISANTLIFSLTNAAANTVLGNFTGSPAGPTYGLVPLASMATITANRLMGNPTGSTATPSLIQLGYGLIFQGGKLAFDSAGVKDTSYAVNGLRFLGTTHDSIGLGGSLYLNTNISGANLYSLSYDSFPAASGRGFRVNFIGDQGWDMIVRDSGTGYWTRIPKGAPGQSWQMLYTGGLGWAAQAGGGGSSTLTRQNITSGTSATVTGGNYLVQFNFSSVAATYTLTTPNSPVDQDIVDIQTGRTILAPNPEITSFTIQANTGQFLNFASNPTTLNSGEPIRIRYNATGSYWDRIL